MLGITRKRDETIGINKTLKASGVRICGNRTGLRISVPRGVSIDRFESPTYLVIAEYAACTTSELLQTN